MVLIVHDVYVYLLLIVDWSFIMSTKIYFIFFFCGSHIHHDFSTFDKESYLFFETNKSLWKKKLLIGFTQKN